MSRSPYRQRGFALIVTLWIVAVLAVLALSFARTVMIDQRRCANTVAAIQARQGALGAVRYLQALLQVNRDAVELPDYETALLEHVPIGSATVWFIAPTRSATSEAGPAFGLVDEGAKLNLNTATHDMLLGIPGMTAELAAAIIDWRDDDDQPRAGGAESETYLRLDRPYQCKNAPFESGEELRLVYGCTADALYGSDRNLNYAVDPWEQDGSFDVLGADSMPAADEGILHYVTVWSVVSATRSDGSPRINVNDRDSEPLIALIRERLGTGPAASVQLLLSRGRPRFGSVMEFALTTELTPEQLARIENDITAADGNDSAVPVNVNTASPVVLACLPGIDEDDAATLVAYRTAYPDALDSVMWVTEVLSRENALLAAPFITTRISRVSADIVAVGPHGRGYRRLFVVFDTSGTDPSVVYARDRSALGWALGTQIREDIEL
jgi:type II secretory pathway component PulK